MITWATIAFILVAGFGMTFIAMRLVEQQAQPAGNSPDLVRPIRIADADERAETSPTETALARLDAMVGLAPVKQEVKALIARMQV